MSHDRHSHEGAFACFWMSWRNHDSTRVSIEGGVEIIWEKQQFLALMLMQPRPILPHDPHASQLVSFLECFAGVALAPSCRNSTSNQLFNQQSRDPHFWTQRFRMKFEIQTSCLPRGLLLLSSGFIIWYLPWNSLGLVLDPQICLRHAKASCANLSS